MKTWILVASVPFSVHCTVSVHTTEEYTTMDGVRVFKQDNQHIEISCKQGMLPTIEPVYDRTLCGSLMARKTPLPPPLAGQFQVGVQVMCEPNSPISQRVCCPVGQVPQIRSKANDLIVVIDCAPAPNSQGAR